MILAEMNSVAQNTFSLIFILLFLFIQDASSQHWLRQQTPTNRFLFRCSFPDSLNGWAAGEDGVIIRTSNGGTNWLSQNSPVDFFIYDIFFLNPRLGWAIANDNFVNGSAVLSTTNGGTNWSFYRYPDSTVQLFAIHYKDSLNGFMAGYTGKIFRTTNGGVNWQIAQVDSSSASGFPIYRISFNNNFGIASGGAYDLIGAVWVTTNGGINWKSVGIGGEPFFCFDILSLSNVIVLGGDFEFGAVQSKTYNSGMNWNYTYLNTFGIPKGLSFRTESEGWAVLSISPKFLYTLDTGNTWNSMNVPDTISLYDITFTDPYHGYAVGTNGGVFRYNSSVIGILNEGELSETFILKQNYPNPFNGQTTVSFSLSGKSETFILLYDCTGRLVKNFSTGILNAGSHKFILTLDDLPSSVYFLKLQTENYSQSIKIVLVK